MQVLKTDPDVKTKILVVEDDQLTRLALCGVLQGMHYETMEAGDGDSGMEMFERERPTITFIDILLPGRDGLSLISEILAISPDAVIVAMSSGGESKNTSFLEWAQKLGALRMISKPFKPEDIRLLLNTL